MSEIALITGASSGIGAAISTLLAAQGVTVVLVARRESLLEELAAKIQEAGGRALVRKADVTQKEQVVALGAWVRREIGLPTILVNNAGIAHGEDFSTAAAESWEPMIDLNIKAGLHVISEFLADLKTARKGHIVNITSVCAKVSVRGLAVYCGSKGFWTGASECLRLELAGSGVKVTNVLPGGTNTDMLAPLVLDLKLVPEDGVPAMMESALQPGDVAQLVWEVVSKPERCYLKDVLMTATVQE